MTEPDGAGELGQRWYKHYLLIVLLIIVVFNYVDRQALGLLMQSIKVDLQLSDTQLGLLTGLAFALFYSVMGVPIARWADRGNRVAIVSLTAILWSIAVALCGSATTFTQLLLIRVCVAVGEAGCVPPAYSLLADYFNRAERPRAVAIYGLGGPLSFVVGYFLAGWLNELYGWRMTFVLLGLPGVLVGALAWFTLREPRRRGLIPAMGGARLHAEQPTWREVASTLWRNATFRQLLFCLSIMFFFIYGVTQWQPAFLIRSYGLTTREIGGWLALLYGGGGLVGAYLGGELASRFAAGNERLQLKGMAFATVVASVLSVFTYVTSNTYVGFIFIAAFVVGMSMTNGPMFAMIQTLVPQRMRALAFALVYLFANLIGMGLGPLAVGALSDALHPWLAEESLRFALLIVAPGNLLAAWCLWRASKTVVDDLGAPAVASPRGASIRDCPEGV